jgi:hypothetical protein
MLNPQKMQETIEVGRRILSDRAHFDRAERDYKLAIAGNIAGALQAVKSGADLDEPLKKAFGSPNNLTSWRTNGVFREWAGEHPEQARRAARSRWPSHSWAGRRPPGTSRPARPTEPPRASRRSQPMCSGARF